MITQVTKLNLVPGGVLPRINVTQYDYGSRALEFLIFNGDQRFTLASGMTARIQGTKPDKCGFDYAATVSTANNKITANLTQQMTACHGEVLTELVILKNGERIGTINFILDVQQAGLSDETVVSDSELPDIITQATAQMEAAAASAKLAESFAKGNTGTRTGENTDNANYYRQQAANSATTAGNQASAAATSATNSTNQALKSEGYAVGTQNGAAVGSTSPYYHKSSKYFSEQASSSASSAAASADRAQSYSVNTPYIGGNGNWFIWDSQAGVYIDSGVDASITVRIADITMLDPTDSPYVTNTGTATDPIFHLFLPRGKGITQIVKTGTVGLQDTYRIDYSDGATSTFVVTNGKGINTITKTSTSGLVDTYTITYNVGSPTTFTVTNGKTAYQSAVEGGYTGTEAEFEEDLASFELWAQTASAAATDAAGSATEAAQSASDAANSAELARVYADFIEPHFIIQNNRLYIKDDAVGEFILENNRLYMKLVS
jgi:hypothetical protein